jgi:hypothetical protein
VYGKQLSLFVCSAELCEPSSLWHSRMTFNTNSAQFNFLVYVRASKTCKIFESENERLVSKCCSFQRLYSFLEVKVLWVSVALWFLIFLTNQTIWCLREAALILLWGQCEHQNVIKVIFCNILVYSTIPNILSKLYTKVFL